MKNDEFRVIRIISKTEVIVNIGNKYIEVGNEIIVYGISENIKDPLTAEDLGSIRTPKAKLIVTEVYDRLSVCMNAVEDSFALQVMPNILYSKPAKLNIDDEDIEPIDYKYSPIKVGDSVSILY